MTRNNTQQSNNNNNNKINQKNNKKYNADSDNSSSSDSDYIYDSDEYETETNSEYSDNSYYSTNSSSSTFIDTNNKWSKNKLNQNTYQKFLQKRFPSTYLKNKIKNGDKKTRQNNNTNPRKRNIINDETSSDDETSSENTTTNIDNIAQKCNSRKSNNHTYNLKNKQGNKCNKKQPFSIICAINNDHYSDNYDNEYIDSEYDSTNMQSDTENEDEEVSSDDDTSSGSDSDETDSSSLTDITSNTYSKYLTNNVNCDIKNKIKTLSELENIQKSNQNDKHLQKSIQVYKADLKKTIRHTEKKNLKQKAKNVRIFKKLTSDKQYLNDVAFYKHNLEIEEQKKLIKQVREINSISKINKPYKITLLESDIPIEFKSVAMNKLNTLKQIEPGSGEFHKIKSWIDTFMKIPFGKTAELPISIENGIDKCTEFMEKAKQTLDEAVYGLNDAKMQIMQLFGQLITNPKSIGTAIAIHGPPGTGKTSLVKEGISKILNRPFAFIALGGATDSSYLEGHSYTYEGSTWGKIVQILVDSKCMNPIIYFDELDKISDTPKGEEITGILTHLTDTTQNSHFTDKYFAEINFDLSKCLFIFSYNDETKINPILKDRMYRIKTKGYNEKEKLIIANDYLLPKIRDQIKFNNGDIIISDEVINYINNTKCAQLSGGSKENGVRNLKRCLETIYTKINLCRLLKPNTKLFDDELPTNISFPLTITKNIVDKLIKTNEPDNNILWSLYV